MMTIREKTSTAGDPMDLVPLRPCRHGAAVTIVGNVKGDKAVGNALGECSSPPIGISTQGA